MKLVKDMLKGSQKSLARIITLVENGEPETFSIMKEISRHTGKAHVIGFTGPPGVGKSSTILHLTKYLRKKNKKVGIIVVDPSSTYTGGAFLGDRVRMHELFADDSVFIRSLATRGKLGGISQATVDVINILDAFGKDVIIVETVGAGQSEIEIRDLVHTSIVMMIPGLGDDIQAMKAGIMEIGDIFVVNKASVDNKADRTVRQLAMALRMIKEAKCIDWEIPVVKVSHNFTQGIDEIYIKTEEHKKFLKKNKMFSLLKKDNVQKQIYNLILEDITKNLKDFLEKEKIDSVTKDILNNKKDIYQAADMLTKKYLKVNKK